MDAGYAEYRKQLAEQRATERAEKMRQQVLDEEQSHPLSRSLLWLFQEQRRRLDLAEIVAALDADQVAVERHITWLDENGWLEVVDGKYYFTNHGFFHLRDQMLYGSSDPVPDPPDQQEVHDFFVEALEGAERLEEAGHVDDALERLSDIETQALEHGFDELARRAHRLIEEMV